MNIKSFIRRQSSGQLGLSSPLVDEGNAMPAFGNLPTGCPAGKRRAEGRPPPSGSRVYALAALLLLSLNLQNLYIEESVRLKGDSSLDFSD